MLAYFTLFWLVGLYFITVFFFISPWPAFLPSIFLSFILGYISSIFHQTFLRNFIFINHDTPKEDQSTKPDAIKQQIHQEPPQTKTIATKKMEHDKIDEMTPDLVDEDQNLTVSTSDTPCPPLSEWVYPPLFIRFIEQNWVIDSINNYRRSTKPYKRTTHSSWKLPSYTVSYPYGPLKIKNNSEIESNYVNHFETPFFKGKVIIRVNNLDENTDKNYFSGKKRSAQTCIQGKFKFPYKFSEVLTGQIFNSSFINLPPIWLVKLGFLIIKQLSPNMQVDISGAKPFALSPLITAVQSLHVAHDRPGNDNITLMAPNLSLKDIPEETSLLGDHFANKKLSRHERKAFFRDIKNLNKYRFNTEYIYTMDFYQHIFTPSNYNFNVGFYNFDLSPYLNGQAIESMAVLDRELFSLPKDESTKDSEENFSYEPNKASENIKPNNLSESTNEIVDQCSDSNFTKTDQPYERAYLWRIQMIHEKIILNTT